MTTITSSIRVSPKSVPASFQRRWATNEAEAKHEEEEAPISKIQPTPQEEVENAIQSDNASESQVQAESSESGTTQAEAQDTQGTIDSVVESATAATSKAAETVKETVQDVYQAATGGSRPDRPAAREGSLIPKPTIYIGNLFFDVTENDLVKELARFGTITNCRLMRDSRGLSKGYVRNACLVNYYLNTNTCSVSGTLISKPPNPPPKPSKLSISNFSRDVASPFNTLPSKPPKCKAAPIAQASP